MHDAPTLPHLKFGVGQPVHRKEDPRLVSGRGRYADDVDLPGQAYARIVRSHHPHGRIRAIKARRALALPGVLAVYTAADVARLWRGRDGASADCAHEMTKQGGGDARIKQDGHHPRLDSRRVEPGNGAGRSPRRSQPHERRNSAGERTSRSADPP